MGRLILAPKAPDGEENEWDRVTAQGFPILLIVVFVNVNISISRCNDYSFKSGFMAYYVLHIPVITTQGLRMETLCYDDLMSMQSLLTIVGLLLKQCYRRFAF